MFSLRHYDRRGGDQEIDLGDHADAEVAKGVKQFTENFIKKRLKEVKNIELLKKPDMYHCRKKSL